MRSVNPKRADFVDRLCIRFKWQIFSFDAIVVSCRCVEDAIKTDSYLSKELGQRLASNSHPFRCV